MGNVWKSARKFVIENDLRKLDYETLEKAINNLGFDIIRFDKTDPKTVSLFKVLKIEGSKKCFTYIAGNYRHIFLAEYLSSDEYIFMLLHEIGHIKLGHLLKNNTYSEELDEVEAHEFAFEVLRYIKKKSLTLKISKIFAVIISVVLLLYIISFWNKRSDYDNSKAAETLPRAVLDTDSSLNEDEEIFYVTSAGEKYHRRTCSIIKNKTNLHYGTREELEGMGYEPCKLCIGD